MNRGATDFRTIRSTIRGEVLGRGDYPSSQSFTVSIVEFIPETNRHDSPPTRGIRHGFGKEDILDREHLALTSSFHGDLVGDVAPTYAPLTA